MRTIVLLSGDEPVLAYGELKGAAAGEDGIVESVNGRLAIVSGDRSEQVFHRMGYARSGAVHLISGDMKDVSSALESMEIPEGRYAVRAHKYGEFSGRSLDVERNIGATIGRRREINLKRPEHIIDVFLGPVIHAGIRIPDMRDFSKREPVKKPFFSPVTLHPRMARALINLTGMKRGQRILDPFCGTGAVLVEAGLMGMKAVGTDYDEDMLEGSRRNLEHYGVEAELLHMEISEIEKLRGVDAISTDPPYGRSSTTNREPVESLYARAFRAMAGTLDRGKRMSVILPSENYVSLAEDFRVLEKYSVKVHRSLTRHFYVLERS